MSSAIKDALYLAVVLVLAIFFFRILWQFGALILIIAGAYYLYTRFIKKDNKDLFWVALISPREYNTLDARKTANFFEQKPFLGFIRNIKAFLSFSL